MTNVITIPLDRRRLLLDMLEADGRVAIVSASEHLGVSEQTIRRDLDSLSAEGLMLRVHGGAIATGGVRFEDRLRVQRPGKKIATLKLLKYIPSSGVIYLDGSTTVLSMLSAIAKHPGLEVVTSNTETFARLSALLGIKATLIGGTLDERTGNLVGPIARRGLTRLAFTAAFFSCYGLSSKIGPTEATVEDAEVKALACERSENVYVAVDDTKLSRIGAGGWSCEKNISLLATEQNKKSKLQTEFKKWFKKVV